MTGGSITGPTGVLIAGKSSANLTYQATIGTLISMEWLKDGHPLSPSNRTTFSADNSSVSIDPVQDTDNGQYQCRIINPVSTDTASYTLTVNYGPENGVILGGNTAEVGSSIALYCSAASVPPAAVNWILNGTQTDVNAIVYAIRTVSYTDRGNYTCVATNDITGRSLSIPHLLIVNVPQSSVYENIKPKIPVPPRGGSKATPALPPRAISHNKPDADMLMEEKIREQEEQVLAWIKAKDEDIHNQRED
ncbi:hypothetical protein SKAU_G00223320 [Synaphobranchus kaupii]|uniref:Ig-like domain-containing protein n=1 Tax=Synaphobranchus kaupii TaxID=118154 RepID=A0A9Q1IU22_SYNKA|nr:hypothetical protein SKAU_G00223320 [Synaphobranchus kaupii]